MYFSLGKAGNVCIMYAHTKQPQGTAADCWAFSYRRQFKPHLFLLWPSAPGIVCCFSFLVRTYTIKNVEPVLSLVPRSIGLRIAPSCRNEQRWKPHAVYEEPISAQGIWWNAMNQRGRTIHLSGAFPLLCFWQEVWICEVHRTSKSKRQGTLL